jgi:AcrR family transcriptional regulator
MRTKGGLLSVTNREKRIENLQRSNEESHRLIVDSLRQALYTMLKTRDIDSIKVVDLVKAAGVSRGGFYRNFYLVTDVLKDDICDIADDVRRVSSADVSANWQIILNTVYQHREKIPLLLKAGMGMEILRQINRSIDGVNEEYRLRLIAWNGVIFNCILWWAERNFADDPEALSRQLTEITEPLLTVQQTTFPSGE